jgi:hypothetical protein
MLPTEGTAMPKDRSTSSPTRPQQADRLNVFNDSSTADDIGWMEATTLDNEVVKLVRRSTSPVSACPGADGRSTFLVVDISDAQDGQDPSKLFTFPGGITFDDIEITELLLGQGNDPAISAPRARAHRVPAQVRHGVHGGGNARLPMAPHGWRPYRRHRWWRREPRRW